MHGNVGKWYMGARLGELVIEVGRICFTNFQCAFFLFSLRPTVQQFSIWITIEKRIDFVICAMPTRPSRIPKAKTCFVPWDVWWWKVWGERPNPRPFYSRWPAGHWANVAVQAKSGRRLIGAWDASQDAHIEQSSLNWSHRWQSWKLLTMMKIADHEESNSWKLWNIIDNNKISIVYMGDGRQTTF